MSPKLLLRPPAVLLALGCALIAPAVVPTAFCCQAMVSSEGGDGPHDCCQGKEHGASCPRRTGTTDEEERHTSVMKGCHTPDATLLKLLGHASFTPEPRHQLGREPAVETLVVRHAAALPVRPHLPDVPPPRA